MSAYRDALMIDASASQDRLSRAGTLLERCEGLVMVDGVAALRPRPGEILCEVIDRTPDGHRCAGRSWKMLVQAGSN